MMKNPVLMYHYLGEPPPATDPHRGLTVPPAEFRSQLVALRELGYETVDPAEYLRRLESGVATPHALLTFDDGMRDNHERALPLLAEFRMRATFYVVVEKCLAGDPAYMNLTMLRELLAAGMTIGSHTLTHPRLGKIPAAQARAEVFDSRRRLEDALGVAIDAFCYPYGSHSPEVVEFVRAAGYQSAASTIRDNRNAPADRFTLRRVMVQPGRTGLRFRYSLSPLYHFLHARKNARRWAASA